MRLQSSAPLLLLLAVSVTAANHRVPTKYPDDHPDGPPPKPNRDADTDAISKQSSKFAHAVESTADTPGAGAQKPGTVDAPVDGLDGKPHDGPGLFQMGEKGTGDVGISGGKPQVDISQPPPQTGNHEIINVEDDGEEKDKDKDSKETDQKIIKAYDEEDGADSDNEEEDNDDEHTFSKSGGPVPSDEHKEYVPGGTDTLKDPPIDTPSHLQDASDSAGQGISQPLHSFALSFIMILMSEIGDKTFLVAALMAMKHPRLVVFTAAFSSLVIMSILSAVLGHAVPTLIPKRFTAFLAAGLFLVFGVRMLSEGFKMEKGNSGVQEEMREVEAELEEKSAGRSRSGSLARKLESGFGGASRMGSHSLRRSTSSPSLSDSDEDDYAQARGAKGSGKGRMTLMEGAQNLMGLLLSPAWVQTFIMTFLGEWGDRSQIATIAMAAGQDYWYVTIGAISGHCICTGIAVIGGRMLASRISVRNVTLGGAAAFLLFGLIYLGEALWANAAAA